SLAHFYYGADLGEGGFGKVVLAKYLPSGNLCAIKSVRKSVLHRPSQLKAVECEKKVLIHLRKNSSAYSVCMHACFRTEFSMLFVLDFCDGGNIIDLLGDLIVHNQISEDMLRFYACGMILAVEELHNLSILHRDIKLENFLVNRSGHIKIADFGSTEFSIPVKGRLGTIGYESPEALSGDYYDGRSDYWSVGMCLYLIRYNRNPVYD
ncbi:hypothetical protein CANCADRAFT_18850, partial [Tortispora caseinolytica NRRL Y-17796]